MAGQIKGSCLFQFDLVDRLASQTFPGFPVKVERRDAHFQQPLYLCLLLCDRRHAAVKAAGLYAFYSKNVGVMDGHGK